MRESGEAVVESLGVKPGLKVLDLGCGDGTRRDPSGTLDPRAIAAAGQDPITGCGPGPTLLLFLPVFAVVQVPNLARGRCRCSVGEHLPEDHRKASRGEGRVAQYSCSFRLLPPAFAHRPRHRTLEVGGSTPLGSIAPFVPSRTVSTRSTQLRRPVEADDFWLLGLFAV